MPSDVGNRFWFCAKYAEGSRYEQDGNTVMIRKPVDVQVLTEQRLFGKAGSNSGGPAGPAGPADKTAGQFAGDVTRLIASGQRQEYLALQNDFRTIEVGRLIRFMNVPVESFSYLLMEHQHEPVEVPRFVTGIRREDRIELVCGGTVTIEEGIISARSEMQKSRSTYRAGVDAGVEVLPVHFTEASPDVFQDLRRAVTESRPDPEELLWTIPSGRRG